MSEITSPILLDTTGQEINSTLRDIGKRLADKAFIDDATTSSERVWSSYKIANDFTAPQTAMGTSVTIDPLAGTPIMVETVVAGQTTLVLSHDSTSGDGTQYTTVMPCAGTYNWNTGNFTLSNGAVVQLNSHSIMAFKGTNTLAINEGTLTATYRIVSTGGGGTETPSWDVIYGGSAKGV